jgi:hypothetical protein
VQIENEKGENKTSLHSTVWQREEEETALVIEDYEIPTHNLF